MTQPHYDQSRVYEAANDVLKEGGQINIHPRQMQLFQLLIKLHLDNEINM
jgi:hypothetical protein